MVLISKQILFTPMITQLRSEFKISEWKIEGGHIQYKVQAQYLNTVSMQSN